MYLAVCAGAVRRYLKDNGEPRAGPLWPACRVHRPNTARMSGNRVDNLYVTLGTDIDDPLRRLRHCSEVARSSKEVRSMLGNDLMEQRAEILPPQLYSAVVRLEPIGQASRVRPPINLVVSNVAGRVSTSGWAPSNSRRCTRRARSSGDGLNLTAWKRCATRCTSRRWAARPACPTLERRVVDALHGSLAELLAAAGTQAPAEAPTA